MKEKVLKRILVILMLVMFLTGIVFGAFNRPREVRGAIFETIGLGAGALGALVAAYFATAGISFSGSADTDGNFLGNYVSNWVKNSPSYASNPYFDSNGDFIGSSDDLSIVQNNDNDLVSIIFGKDFAAWLEVLKQSFVSDNSLSVNNTTSLQSGNTIDINGISYPVYSSESEAMNLFRNSYPPYNLFVEQGGDATIMVSENTFFQYLHPYNGQTMRCSYGTGYIDSSNNRIVTDQRVNVQLSNYGNYFIFCMNNGVLSLLRITYNARGAGSSDSTLSVSLGESDVMNMSLDGTLTDGYSDFEDAINQDLTNADEEEVAVVGVGEFPETLDVNNILDGILDKIIGGTLNPTYEGTREDQGTAEEEAEGERPFVPVLPEGWVKVEGLQSFFPFCIPFDLYNTIALLNVPSEAPRFTWRMGFGSIFQPYDIDIDLSPYETVARIFRVMVVIVFLLFLILKTRDLIRG